MKNNDANKSEIKILDAADQVFVKKGYEGARMQEIADKAGINKAMLHYYYRTKDKLFKKVFRYKYNIMFKKLGKVMEQENLTFYDKVSEIIDKYIEFFSKNQFILPFIVTEIMRNPDILLEVIKNPENKFNPKIFVKEIEKEIKAGNIRKVKPVHIIMNVFSMCAFPFFAKPIISGALDIKPKEFKSLMKERKQIILDFIITGLKKK